MRLKTTLMIEIESPDEHNVRPILNDFDDTDNEYTAHDKETQEFKEKYSKVLHDRVVMLIQSYFEDGSCEENVLDDMQEAGIEDWDSFEDYGIKIKVTQK